MSQTSKSMTKLSLSCLTALALGIGAMTMGVAAYRHFSTAAAPLETAYIVNMPQDEDMLRELSRQLMAGTDVAGEEEELARIAPAAGAPLAGGVTP